MESRILDYIKKYDFKKYMNSSKLNYLDDNYKKFAEEFWTDPNCNLTKLKNKYNIDQTIAFTEILKVYPTKAYEQLLEDSWAEEKNIKDIVDYHCIKLDRIKQLLFSIPYSPKEDFCSNCYESNDFYIENDIKNNDFDVYCSSCNSFVKNFVSIDEVISEKEGRVSFDISIEGIERNLNEIKCPLCQAEMIIFSDNISKKYNISCTKCDAKYNDYEVLVKDFNEWKKRAAMMIKIKALEEERIQNLLNKKSIDDINIKKESIITQDESLDTIVYIMDKEYKNDEEALVDLFNFIKLTNRLEKKLLLEICNLSFEYGTEIGWSNSNDKSNEVKFISINSESPIINFLEEKTGILVVRKVLRGLIKKNLIFCAEEKNALHIYPALVKNISKIENLLTPQNISNEISYLIFNKQNYTCYHCGENGRPLKIAYLSNYKNNNDLSSLVGICDTCYDDITVKEVLIDGMITGIEELINESPLSWKFLLEYYSEITNIKYAYESNEQLLEKYSQDDIIKAYAQTIFKFKDKKNNSSFFKYANSILYNSEDGVFISKIVSNAYEVDKWLGSSNK